MAKQPLARSARFRVDRRLDIGLAFRLDLGLEFRLDFRFARRRIERFVEEQVAGHSVRFRICAKGPDERHRDPGAVLTG
jgi:hypothetical protein